MINGQESKFVFLLSLPRSGSTLLSAILNNHSNILSPPEMWFLLSLSEFPYYRGDTCYNSKVANEAFREQVGSELFYQASEKFATHIYNSLLINNGKNIFVDKTPRYYYALETIDQLFPSSKKIWLLRNPLAIVASYKSTWKCEILPIIKGEREHLYYTFDFTLGFWRYCSYFGQEHPLLCKIHYENLVSDPCNESIRICDFLNVQYEEDMFKYRSNPQHVSILKYAAVGDKNLLHYDRPHDKSITLWKTILTKDEIRAVCSMLGEKVFCEMGYGDEFEEAERITKQKFNDEPDDSIIVNSVKNLKNIYGKTLDLNYKFDQSNQLVVEMKNEKFLNNYVREDIQTDPKSTLQDEEYQRYYINFLENVIQSKENQILHLERKFEKITKYIPFKHTMKTVINKILD